MLLLDKDDFPEHWAWWKKDIKSTYNIGRIIRAPSDVNGRGLWAKCLYIWAKCLYLVTLPFYVWFHCTCIIPNSFLYHFIFDHLDDNTPQGFWKPEASISKRIIIYTIAIPQMVIFALLALSFVLVGVLPTGLWYFFIFGIFFRYGFS